MDKKWWTLIAVCAGTFMLLLDVTIVVVALPQIQTALNASFSDVQWVIDAYALTLASLLLTTGVLADRYGRRRLFTIGLIIFTLGSLTCGLAQSPIMLIVSRSGQGVGGAIVFATSLALLAQSFRGKDRGVAFGIWGAITGVAVSLGPILGGAITTGISWRGIFLVNVPVGIAAVAITLVKVEESRAPHPGRPDWGDSCSSPQAWSPSSTASSGQVRPHGAAPRSSSRWPSASRCSWDLFSSSSASTIPCSTCRFFARPPSSVAFSPRLP